MTASTLTKQMCDMVSNKFSRERQDMKPSKEEENRREESERLLGQARPANQNNDFVFDYPYFSKLLLISFWCHFSQKDNELNLNL